MKEDKLTYVGEVYCDVTHHTQFFTYETIEVKRLKCSHPKVKMMYESGGLPYKDGKAGPMTYSVTIVLDNDNRQDFTSESHLTALQEADKFLASL